MAKHVKQTVRKIRKALDKRRKISSTLKINDIEILFSIVNKYTTISFYLYGIFILSNAIDGNNDRVDELVELALKKPSLSHKFSIYNLMVIINIVKGKYNLVGKYLKLASDCFSNINKESINFFIASCEKLNKVQKDLGSNHPYLIACYCSISSHYERLGNYVQAKEFHDKSIEAFEKITADKLSEDQINSLYKTNISLFHRIISEYTSKIFLNTK